MHKKPLVVVEWDDISSYDSWADEKESPRWTVIRCTTVGWRLKGDRKNLIMTSTRADTGKCNDRQVIPKGVVRSIRRLE